MIGHLTLWESDLTNPFERALRRPPDAIPPPRRRAVAAPPRRISTWPLATLAVAASALAPLALALRIGAL